MKPNEFDSWVGRTRTVEDEITAFPLNALAATLDRETPPAARGTAVPPLWHWLYFLPTHRPHQTRHDGHAHGDDFMPPIALPRRVWAGSRFSWHPGNPLRVGQKARRISRIASITPKTGRSGELVFVKVIHEFHNDAGLCFVNEHNSAFRGAAKAGSTATDSAGAETNAAWQRELVPDSILLFRYSALTFNSHRIHYDAPYATREEGYPALLVHGPLQATLLLDLVHRNAPDAVVRSLEFKAVRSAFVDRPLHLGGNTQGNKVDLWATDDAGRLTMTASAEIDS